MRIMMNEKTAYEKLEKFGQQHLLQFFNQLNDGEKEMLIRQIETTDFSVLASLEVGKDGGKRGKITPLAAMELDEIGEKREEFEKIGYQAIRNRKVGAVLLAGGMGTRLGSDDPKGMYDIGITKPVYIFERLIANMMEIVKKADAFIPLYVMTSDKNHTATVNFFKEHDYFGYPCGEIVFFMQEMAPAADYDGKVFLEEKAKISTSPNGNGGWYASMHKSGLTKKVMEEGIEWLNVFAVDNVLQRIADPCFVGAVIANQCSCGAKVVKKVTPDEKVGAICLEDGQPSIVEYYEMTQELMDEMDEKGEPAYNFGVILNYLFSVKGLEEIREKQLPLHVVEKKIPHINKAGDAVKPAEPNGYKFEQLVLDMIHELDSCLPYEVDRIKEFAPIKNKVGVDSVESARKLCRENGIEL